MRRFALFVIAGSALSCSQKVAEQATFVPPAPIPPPLHAPTCARPTEKSAIDVSVLLSQLQVITVTCHTDQKYNALIPHLRPAACDKGRQSSVLLRARLWQAGAAGA